MKPIKVTARKGLRYQTLRLKGGFSAIVFELSDGRKIEVDLMESDNGNLVIRSHAGAVKVAEKSGTLEITAN
jgi:hypothetical protein